MALVAASPGLGGCTDLKRALGMEKVVPDEFAVTPNAPLAMPPDYTLRPPRPGAAPTQEVPTTQQAKQTIFRASDQQATALQPDDQRSAGETALLRQAGVANVPSNIRDTVNAEAAQPPPSDPGLVDKLLFWRTPEQGPAPNDAVIDPAKEALRLNGGVIPAAATTPGAAGAAPAPGATPVMTYGAAPVAKSPPVPMTPAEAAAGATGSAARFGAAAAAAAPGVAPTLPAGLTGPPTIERRRDPTLG
jgi:hypothetical protein